MTTAMLVLAAMLAAPPPPAPSKLPGGAAAPLASEPQADDDAEPPLLDDELPPPPPPVFDTGRTELVPQPAAPSRRPSALAARPPRPIRWRVEPFIEGGTVRVADRSYRTFTYASNLGQLGVGARADARIGRGPVFLGGGLRYGYAQAYGGPYDSLYTSLYLHQPSAFVRMSVVLLEGLDLVAQAGGGAAFVQLDVSDYDYDFTTDYSSRIGYQDRVLGTFDAKAGVSLYLPKAWLPARGSARVTMGLDLLFGYDMRGKLVVSPAPDHTPDDIRISGASLGDLRIHGFVWSTGLFVRFM